MPSLSHDQNSEVSEFHTSDQYRKACVDVPDLFDMYDLKGRPSAPSQKQVVFEAGITFAPNAPEQT
jgi:hypothetical protein